MKKTQNRTQDQTQNKAQSKTTNAGESTKSVKNKSCGGCGKNAKDCS